MYFIMYSHYKNIRDICVWSGIKTIPRLQEFDSAGTAPQFWNSRITASLHPFPHAVWFMCKIPRREQQSLTSKWRIDPPWPTWDLVSLSFVFSLSYICLSFLTSTFCSLWQHIKCIIHWLTILRIIIYIRLNWKLLSFCTLINKYKVWIQCGIFLHFYYQKEDVLNVFTCVCTCVWLLYMCVQEGEWNKL